MYPQGHMALNLVFLTGFIKLSKSFFSFQPNTGKSFPLWPALLAAVFPDIIDKVVCDVLHLAPFGRNWTHNLTAVAVCSLSLGCVFRSIAIALSWMIGHFGHLIGDFVFIPWFYPWLEYNWPGQAQNIVQGVLHTVQDVGQGHKLRPDAASIWQVKRLIAEFLFLAGAVCSYYCVIQRKSSPTPKKLPVNNLRLTSSLVCLAFTFIVWAYIVIHWDLTPYWSME